MTGFPGRLFHAGDAPGLSLGGRRLLVKSGPCSGIRSTGGAPFPDLATRKPSCGSSDLLRRRMVATGLEGYSRGTVRETFSSGVFMKRDGRGIRPPGGSTMARGLTEPGYLPPSGALPRKTGHLRRSLEIAGLSYGGNIINSPISGPFWFSGGWPLGNGFPSCGRRRLPYSEEYPHLPMA